MKTTSQRDYRSAGTRAAALALLAGAGAWPMTAAAIDFDVQGGRMSVRGLVSVGSGLRQSERSPELVSTVNAGAIGAAGSASSGQNSDDGNLNFDKGDAFSTVLKGYLDLEGKFGRLSGLLRVKAWHDFALTDGDRPWGNVVNGYGANQPLGDDGFDPRARFSGAALQEAYLNGIFSAGDMALTGQLGNQLLPWGMRSAIPGGIAILNPIDVPALRRPGNVLQETRVPFTAAFARLGISKDLALEAFYQIKFQETVLDGCGTYFSTSDYTPQGCDKVFAGPPGSDRDRLRADSFIRRAPTPETSDSGQFGVALNYRAAAIGTEFGVHYAQFHSRSPFVSVIKTTRSGAPLPPPFIPGNADGANVQYMTEYPEDIKLLSLTAASQLPWATVAGELSHRWKQPVQLNASDLLNAFASNTAPSLLRSDAQSAGFGGVFHGFDRFGVTQLQVGARRQWASVLGAQTASFGGEAARKWVHGLPDPTVRRYGRPDVYGLGPVNGACAANAPPKQCSSDGYVTGSAWGYRLRADARYAQVVAGLDLVPSLGFAHDVDGWSFDAVFSEGRKSVVLALRAEFATRYHVELIYNQFTGGRYNNSIDRDFIALSCGARF